MFQIQRLNLCQTLQPNKVVQFIMLMFDPISKNIDYVNNSAPYGHNIGSYPVKIVRYGNETGLNGHQRYWIRHCI